MPTRKIINISANPSNLFGAMAIRLRLRIGIGIGIIGLFTFSMPSTSSPNENRRYGNEKEIQFKSGEQSVEALEGTIKVLENRAEPKSRLIPLSYVRFPATGKTKSSPIIYLSGGPGGSGISTASYPNFRFPLFMALRKFGDVIALDQRGTGKSSFAPQCTSKQTMSLTEKLTELQVIKLYRSAAKECVEFWKKEGVDVLGYTTIQNAMDIDSLRQHFQADKVTLWGISYGSHLALASLKVMQGKIDKLVIASAEGLNQTVKLPARTDAYFDRLQLAINQQAKASKTYPDIKAMMHRVHNKLKNTPIMLKIPQKDGNEIDFLFQSFHMQGIASAMIADPHRGVSRLLSMYQGLDNGVSNFLPQTVKRAGFDDKKISFNVMSFAMDVASGMTASKEKLITKQSKTSLLGNLLNFPMPQLNKVVSGLDLGDEFRSFPKSDVPTLLLTGTLDGRTYIQAQKEATQGLTNLTQVIVKNAGHNLFMSSPIITEVIKDFLAGKNLQTKEIEIKLPTFVK
jgi:pimeloyl-ACP methyl ester carboxylesterase